MFQKDEKQLDLFGNTEEALEDGVRAAMASGRLCMECLEEVELDNEVIARVVVYHPA